MLAADEIQVNFNVTQGPRQALIAPSVRTAAPARLDYTIIVRKIGHNGNSSISQTGRLDTEPGKDTALPQSKVGVQAGDTCQLTMSFKENGVEVFRQEYDCNPAK